MVYGGGLPAIIWRQVMSAGLEGVPVEQFRPVDPGVATGQQTPVPDVSGQSPAEATRQLQAAGFTVRVASGQVDDPSHPAGTVARTSPAAGVPATTLSLVTVFVSTGQAPPAPPAPQPQPQPQQPTDQPAPQPTDTQTSAGGPAQQGPGSGNGKGPKKG